MSQDVRGAFLSWKQTPLSDTEILYWDCIVKENASFKAHVTRHPVEAGVDITDHIRPEPKSFTLQGYISQSPIRTGNVILSRHNEVLDIVQPPSSLPFLGTLQQAAVPNASVSIQPYETDTQTDLVLIVTEALQALQAEAQLVTITTPHWSYDNMIVETFDVSGTSEYGTGRMYDVTLTEIRTVQSLTVQAPIPAIPQVQVKAATGDQPATPLISSPAKLADLANGFLKNLIPQ